MERQDRPAAEALRLVASGEDDESVSRVAWTVELDLELAEQVRRVARAIGMRPRRVLPLLARHGLEALDKVERLERNEG